MTSKLDISNKNFKYVGFIFQKLHIANGNSKTRIVTTNSTGVSCNHLVNHLSIILSQILQHNQK